MDILSYRGPSNPGGVSGALTRLMERHGTQRQCWWYISRNTFMLRQNLLTDTVCNIPKHIIDGHYRYCNNFLWPVMHDLPEYAQFAEPDKLYYQQFNMAVALNLVQRAAGESCPNSLFIQDYQLSLAAQPLSLSVPGKICIFWHIPWPKHVPDMFVRAVSEVARGLLHCKQIGFHTQEYARNFLCFVDSYLPDYLVDHEEMVIRSVQDPCAKHCEIIVQPLGIDNKFWQNEAEQWTSTARDRLIHHSSLSRYVLSVDRADYTKGVLARLKAIDEFFLSFPEQRLKITFVQVCQRTREGLPVFDKYWNECVELTERINSRWRTDSWKPILWLADSLSPSVLAALYKDAAVMLVNPMRDGLNLTAKEYVACAGRASGALLLSAGAGAWCELGTFAMPVDDSNPRQIAQSIQLGLSAPPSEVQFRLNEMKKILDTNDLSIWWHRFNGATSMLSKRRRIAEKAATLGQRIARDYELSAGAG